MRKITINNNGLVVGVHENDDNIPDQIPIETLLTNEELLGKYIYQDGVLSVDPLYAARALNKIKSDSLSQLKKKYSLICNCEDPTTGKDIYVDCAVNGTTYRMNAGQAAATNMDAGVRIFELSGADHMPIVRDFHNVNHTNVPIADARSIALQQGADALNHWQQKGAMVDAINSATTVDEVQAVDITFNVNVL